MQYSDLVAGQTANPPVYDQQGMQTATAQTGNGYQPLPQLNPQTGGATYAGAQTQDPIAIFNQNLYQMLQDRQKQSAGQNAPLMAQSNQLQNQNISNAMSQPNLPMRPGDALNARQDAGNIYNPAITNLKDRMTLNNQAITDFKSAIDAATTFGEKYAAQIKPDDATIKAVTEQMQAGFIPDQTVLDKVAKYLPNDIWAQAAAAKKAQSASGGVPTPNSTKEIDQVNSIISAHPGEWGQAADAINSALNDPNAATRYDALLKKAYLLPDLAQKAAAATPPKNVAEWTAGRNAFVNANTYVDATTAGAAYDKAVPKPSASAAANISIPDLSNFNPNQ